MKTPIRFWYLAAAVAAMGIALSPRLRFLADGYLFSAYMLQHLILQLAAPPLLLLALPPSGDGAPKLSLRAAAAFWAGGVGAMWIWHDPALCNAVLGSPALRLFQQASLVLAGLAFWWPVAGPRREWRLPPLLGIVYLFTACLGCTILGIVITFAPAELYSRYFHAAAAPLLFKEWALTPAADQRLGGLLMWAPACLVYVIGILGLLNRLYATPEFEPKTT